MANAEPALPGPADAVEPPPTDEPLDRMPTNPYPHFSSNLHVTTLLAKKRRIEEDIERMVAQLEFVETKIASEKERLGISMETREILKIGLQRFNHSGKPKAGIKFLIENGYFPDGGTAQEVGLFLFQHTTHNYHDDASGALEKTALGEYLGESDEFNQAVLKAFSKCFNFTGMEFVEALRHFLWAFKLPGEGQKVDRFMEVVASTYYDVCCETSEFNHPDGAYLMAFSIMMLQTTLHNPDAVGGQMDFDGFKGMIGNLNCRVEKGDMHPDWDQPDNRSFSDHFLKGVYATVAESEFKVPGAEGGVRYTFMNPDKTGYLWKQGGSAKTWTKRWVVVKAGCLYYFASQEDYDSEQTPVGIVPLENLLVTRVERRSRGKNGGFYFALRGRPGADGKPMVVKGCKSKKGVVVQGNHKEYLFRSETVDEVHDWIRCIEINLNQIEHGFSTPGTYVRSVSMPRPSATEVKLD
mmetsp:Transcript_6221/g.16044  ORF Transcript_6221/g.16044 Transcript_6221/m.16044 type:complete len:467 (+) Transcript_6221:324-1724(+)|eukprot:CAMPEP_0182923494 /NCGR_PEP_ID=MMETSP0105_2-20130417/5469_1 /TAXON_ID=81532 ORGANISM="Acanthoeca-like sp., Strain 10tr" /NCGR_SAMPLE_ID=MMETSP0105_2 /ASSEMBLY_ACC=CAM_ASM_000205 /LENGTH=466 /DNA_ID=CAMNT_0025061211 /DNA_START=276 /DNA_END=1676 /DNA_ORIENTATION=-